MCAVCRLYDYGRSVPMDRWTVPAFLAFKRTEKDARDLDTALGDADCHDPAKAAWMRGVEAAVATRRCQSCGSSRPEARHWTATDCRDEGGRIVYFDTEPFSFGGYCASKECPDPFHERSAAK